MFAHLLSRLDQLTKSRWKSSNCEVMLTASCRNEARFPSPLAADRKSTRLNSSHSQISYAVFCLKKKITSIKLRQCSSKIITTTLSFISGRSASLQRTFKKSFTSFSHSTRNKTRVCFFFVSTATTEIYTLSLHDALPI